MAKPEDAKVIDEAGKLILKAIRGELIKFMETMKNNGIAPPEGYYYFSQYLGFSSGEVGALMLQAHGQAENKIGFNADEVFMGLAFVKDVTSDAIEEAYLNVLERQFGLDRKALFAPQDPNPKKGGPIDPSELN